MLHFRFDLDRFTVIDGLRKSELIIEHRFTIHSDQKCRYLSRILGKLIYRFNMNGDHLSFNLKDELHDQSLVLSNCTR